MKLIRGIIENLMLCNVNMSNNPVRFFSCDALRVYNLKILVLSF